MKAEANRDEAIALSNVSDIVADSVDSGREVIIEIAHLKKTFGQNEVLKDINFSVCKGDVTCIIGPSGSGKSTLLRCINLFEDATAEIGRAHV